MKHTFKHFVSIGFISLMVVAQTRAATQFTNEFWISTNMTTANLGTLSDPYDGSTATKFDLVMTNMPANSTIHILAGSYQTQGYSAGRNGWLAKSGQKIFGSGIDATILHLTAGSPSGTQIIVNGATATNNEVTDLTIDASSNTNVNGLALFGNKLAVRRVKAVNFTSTGTNTVFPIQISPGTSPASEGNVIEECEISQFNGGPIAGIIMFGSASNYVNGTIRHNRVFLSNAATSGATSQMALSCGYGYNVLIDGNYVNGSGSGLYAELPNTNLVIVHNTFKNCDYGVLLQNAKQINTTFSYNTIQLANEASVSTYGCYFNTNATFTNVIIIGNTYGYDSSAGAASSDSISAGTANGIVICNNSIDSGLTNTLTGCTGLNLYNNVDLFGSALTNMNQIQPPNGITRRTIHSSYTPLYSDRYIGYKGGSGGVSVTLPSAVGHPGKEFIFADESGTTPSISILPTSPDLINGGTLAVTVTGKYGSKTVISDGSNWFVR